MTHYLPRLAALVCVVFCCTFSCAATPALAQPFFRSQTFTLNGVWADVIFPDNPVRIGDTFWISVVVRPHADPPLQEYDIVLDGRPLGRRDGIELTPGIADGIANNYEWYEPASLDATPGDVVLRITVSEATGRGGVIELPLRLLPATDPVGDADNDTLPDLWEVRLGLSAESATGDDGPEGDPDGDGWRNRDEFLRNTHPRGFYTRYFAEGVNSEFFFTFIAPEHLPGVVPGRIHERQIDANGWATSTTTSFQLVGGALSSTYAHDERRRLESSYATIIESDAPFAAERWTRWPAYPTGSPFGYGSHASEGTRSPSKRWLFAEGVTGAFHTYVALLNPSTQRARLTVTYFGAAGATPISREHILEPDSRGTIDVNVDAAGLASTDVAIAIDSDVPIAAERSIYLDAGGAVWGAGTSSIGAPAPATEWFLAEGLTNSLFDTYLLLLNPETTAATVEIRVLREDGAPITLTRTIAPRSRATIYMNDADPALASSSTSFGLAVRSINGTPIVVERTMWWNDPVRGTHWIEGHTSMGTPELATRWIAKESLIAGLNGELAAYLLLANPNATPATVRVTLPPPFPGAPTGAVTVTVPASRRLTLDLGNTFVLAEGRPDGRHASVLVESIGDMPVPIVAERSVYANTWDVVWELGCSTMLAPLPPP